MRLVRWIASLIGGWITGSQWAGEQHPVRGGRRDSPRNSRTLRRRGQVPVAQEGRRSGVLVPVKESIVGLDIQANIS